MKWQSIARTIGLVVLGCSAMAGLPALAQTNSSATGLNAELSQAVCQQDWARAIRVIDRMRAITPAYRQGELTLYRSRLQSMLTSGASIPNWQCGAGGNSLPTPNPLPSPGIANNSTPVANPIPNPATNPATDPDSTTESTTRGVRSTDRGSSNSSGNNNPSSGSTPPTGANNIIDRARNLNQTINNP